MTEKNQIYKCSICGNIVEVVNASGGTLVCCGQPMKLLLENSDDKAAKEKHVPVVEKTKTGYKIKIGSVEHPMLPEHYIQFIELIADGVSYKKFLNPGEKPEAEFCIKAEKITVREFCNLHGLWKNEKSPQSEEGFFKPQTENNNRTDVRKNTSLSSSN